MKIMTTIISSASLALALSLPAFANDAAERPTSIRMIDVDVIGVTAGEGQLMVGLCNKSQFLTPRCEVSKVFQITKNWKQRIALPLPKTGNYAVQVAYDRDGDNTLATNRYGAPTEPVGFSNNPNLKSRAPIFSEVSIDVQALDTPIEIKLR